MASYIGTLDFKIYSLVCLLEYRPMQLKETSIMCRWIQGDLKTPNGIPCRRSHLGSHQNRTIGVIAVAKDHSITVLKKSKTFWSGHLVAITLERNIHGSTNAMPIGLYLSVLRILDTVPSKSRSYNVLGIPLPRNMPVERL